MCPDPASGGSLILGATGRLAAAFFSEFTEIENTEESKKPAAPPRFRARPA